MQKNGQLATAISLLLILSAISVPTRAMGVMEGRTLYSLCTASKNDPVYYQKDATCQGFIDGVREGTNLMFLANQQLKGNNNPEPLICIPSYVTPIVFRNAFISYYETHQSVRELSATEIILQVNLAAYPC